MDLPPSVAEPRNSGAVAKPAFSLPMVLLALYFAYGAVIEFLPIPRWVNIIGPYGFPDELAWLYKGLACLTWALCCLGIVLRQRWGWRLILGSMGYLVMFFLVHWLLAIISPGSLPEICRKIAGQPVPLSEGWMFFWLSGELVSVIAGAIVIGWYVYKHKAHFSR